MPAIRLQAIETAARKYCQLVGLDPDEVADGQPRWQEIAIMLREKFALQVALQQQINLS